MADFCRLRFYSSVSGSECRSTCSVSVGASYSNGPRCPSVCLSHANISETKRDRRMVTRKLKQESWLSDSESAVGFAIEVRFHHFGCFRVDFAHSYRNGRVGLVNVVNGSVGTVTSRHRTGQCVILAGSQQCGSSCSNGAKVVCDSPGCDMRFDLKLGTKLLSLSVGPNICDSTFVFQLARWCSG